MIYVIAHLSLLGFVLLGLALLLSLRLVYGTRQHRDDVVQRVLLIVAWLLIFSGAAGTLVCATGLASLVIASAAALVAEMSWEYFRRSEHQILMHLLASSAVRGMPLHLTAEAYGLERDSTLALRATVLADHLQQGRSLVESLHGAGIHNTPDLEVAARVGEELGLLAPLLQDATRELQDPAAELRRSFHKLFYLSLILLAATLAVAFIVQFILPRFLMLAQSFSVQLPALSEWGMTLGSAVAEFWLLSGPLLFFLVLVILIAAAAFVGMLPPNFPLVNRFSRQFDHAQVLMILSRALEGGVSIEQTVDSLARNHPRTVVRARLALTVNGIRAGVPWTNAFRYAGIISRVEAELLEAAGRADNLAWALREAAERGLRRFDYRLRCALGIGFPVLLAILATLIGLIVVAVFLPLPALIQGLA